MPSIGHLKASVVMQEVPNPLHSRDHATDRTNPLKIMAAVNMRESAITMLAAKGAINEAQERAAERFRLLWERMGGAGAGAIDYSRERVDGGQIAQSISASQMQAGRDLNAAMTALRLQHGEYACRLVGYICGEGYSIHDLTETRRQRDTMTDNLRGYLDVLAELWNMKARRRVG